ETGVYPTSVHFQQLMSTFFAANILELGGSLCEVHHYVPKHGHVEPNCPLPVDHKNQNSFLKLDIHNIKIAIHDNQNCFKQSNHYFFFTKLYVNILLNLCNHLHMFYYVQNCVLQCQCIKLKLLQHQCRKHDYFSYLNSLNTGPKIENGTYLWLMFLIYHVFAWRILKNIFLIIFSHRQHMVKATNI